MQTSFSAINVKELMQSNLYQRQKMTSKLASNKQENEDAVSIGQLTPEKTQAILNRQIADKLEERFKEEGIELKGLQAADYTPEKVSERILGFVSGRVLSEQDNDKQSELMQQARAGIEKGFEEARDILESLDVLNGKVKEDVDSTYGLIQQGLERLQQQVDGIAVENDEEEKTLSQVQQASMEHSFSRNENTRVEITTQDGDKVLIDLYKQNSGQLSRSYTQTEDGVSFSSTHTLSASAGISYQVEGELDEDEQKAIDELLKDVSKVSDSFFSGNVQNAFKQALKMDFDGEELAKFSLNMNYQENRQVAVSTYNQYQTQSVTQHRDDSSEASSRNELKELSDFVKQMDNLFENPFAQRKFAHPEQAMGDLFKEMNQLLHSKEMKDLEKDSSSLLDSLVDQIKQMHSQPTAIDAEEKEELVS